MTNTDQLSTTEVCSRIGAAVAAAWEAGWQPADLHRVVLRECGRDQAELAGDAIAANLAQYATATIDDRWLAQLEEIEAEVWWPGSTNFIQARADHQAQDDDSLGWPGAGTDAPNRVLMEQAGQITRLLQVLPKIERISPLPGQARSRRTAGGEVNQKILGRVRMMLAKAESTNFEAEAETFTAAAQSLMARHSIDTAILESQQDDASRPDAIRLGLDRPYESAKYTLLNSIASANRCRAVWYQKLGFATVVGFSVDLRAVELLFASLSVQATTAMQAHGSKSRPGGRSRTRSFRKTFLTAYAQRVGERLEEAAQSQAREAAEQASQLPGSVESGGAGRHQAGNEIVRVLGMREQAVDDALSEMFLRLRTTRQRTQLDPEGWLAGQEAANRAHLGPPGRLDG